MTIIPARLLRHAAEACRSRPPPTRRDQDRDVYIMEAARNAFVQNGRAGVSIPQFAYATGLSAVTLRRHISDVHHLFAMVLTEHLLAINQAVASVSRAGDDLFVRRRAAYFRATRGVFSVPTPVHFLLLRDRFTLPPDELEPIERLRRTIGIMLGGPITEATLDLLDNAYLNLGQIEALVATLEACARPGGAYRRRGPAQGLNGHAPPPVDNPPAPPAIVAHPARPPAWTDNTLAAVPDDALQTSGRPRQETPPGQLLPAELLPGQLLPDQLLPDQLLPDHLLPDHLPPGAPPAQPRHATIPARPVGAPVTAPDPPAANPCLAPAHTPGQAGPHGTADSHLPSRPRHQARTRHPAAAVAAWLLHTGARAFPAPAGSAAAHAAFPFMPAPA